MYLKLALRNAKRSAIDYLLYVFTMVILVSIMCVSNCIAVLGHIKMGFATASLPLLIAFIMVSLVEYINTFMLKQRAKEFATYSLLGMDKNKLSLMFICEICIIGVICFVIGVLMGTSIYYICVSPMLYDSDRQLTDTFVPMLKSVMQTFMYFCAVELISVFRVKHKICHLQIRELMKERNRNQRICGHRYGLWRIMLVCSVSSFVIMLAGIAFLSGNVSDMAISLIAVPVLIGIVAFYKCLFAFVASKRLAKSDILYKDTNIYSMAEMTMGIKTSSTINSVFCSCLLFSACSFIFGVLLLNGDIVLFSPVEQQWMGFLQISLSIIFIVIYFSILSLMQIVELKQQAKNIRILHYMGKSQKELRSLIKNQTLAKLFIPTFMCFVLLIIGMPFVNYKLNSILPISMNNELLRAVGLFTACFAVLYLCYFQVVYSIIRKYLKANAELHI